jgi:hypothetical protein
MKHIQSSVISQSYSQYRIDKPDWVWAVELLSDSVSQGMLDELSERCKKWTGWGFYTDEEYHTSAYLLFESKEEAFVTELSLGKDYV